MAEIAFIALGSNLGDSAQLARNVFDELQLLTDRPILASSLWRSEPVDCPPGSPSFINAVAAIEARAGETPETLLAKLKSLEEKFGRRPKKIHNEPRPLDLDLIAFGNRIAALPNLVLPHPRAHLRRFVLQPLSEIAPNFIFPGQKKTATQLLTELPGTEDVRRL